MKNKKKNAFTLIELLMVIAILSILVSITIPRISSRKEEAKRMKALIQIQLYMQALEKYKLDNNNYPSTEEGLKILTNSSYLQAKTIPLDPWGAKYIYLSPGPDNTPYTIISFARDKENGGNGWDKDITSKDAEELIR